MSTATPPDRFVRQAFCQRRIAQPLFERYLPPVMVSERDAETMTAAQAFSLCLTN